MVAVTADKVVVELEARTGTYNAQIRGATENFDRNMRRIEGAGSRAESVTRRYFGNMSTALAAIGPAALGAGLGIGALTIGLREVAGLADKFTRFENRLKTAGIEGENLNRVGDKLFATANKNGVEIEALGAVYARASLASDELGASQQQLDTFTGAVSDALRVQGSSAEASRGALLQLSQALGQDIVRAEEFNSILEGALPIAQAAAKGIDRFGGSVAKLRTGIINGEVTSREFFNGIIKQAPDLAAKAAKANLTLENSFTALYNQLARGIGQSNKSLGATEKLSEGILYLADNLDGVAEAVTVISAAIGSKMVAGLVRAGAEQAKFYGSVAAGNAVIVGGARAAEQKAAAEKALSAAVLAEAKAEQVRSAALVKSVQADIAVQKARFANLVGVDSSTPAGAEVQSRVMARQIGLSRDMAGANALLARSNVTLAAAELRATEAATVHAAALGRTALAARAASVAMRAYSALSGLLGGPVGVALTALAATYLIVSSRTQAAAERTAALQDELRQLGYLADDAADKLDGTKESINKLADDQIRAKVRELKDSLEFLRDRNGFTNFFATMFGQDTVSGIGDVTFAARGLAQELQRLDPDVAGAAREVETLSNDLAAGGLSSDEFARRLAKINTDVPNAKIDAMIGRLRELAPLFIAANKAINDLENRKPAQERDRTTVRGGSAAGDRKTSDFISGRDRIAALSDEGKAIEKRAEAIEKEAKAAGAAISPMTALAQARKEVLGEQDRDAATKASEKFAADAKQSAQVVADLQNAIATFGNERQQAIDSAVRSLPEDATSSRVEEVKRLASALYDMHEAERVNSVLNRDAAQEANDYYADQAAQIGVVGGALVELQFEQARYNELRSNGIAITAETARQVQAEAASVRSVYEEIEKTSEPLRKQIEVTDALHQGFIDVGLSAVDGFDGIADAAESALKQIVQMILQLYVLKPLAKSLFGDSGTAGEGFFGQLISGLGASSGGGAGGGNTPLFAEGGVMTPQGPRALRRFASGGISSRAAIFGEAGPEAAVPLPDGRRIPVDLRIPKAMSSAQNNGGNVEINIENNSSAQVETQTSRGGDGKQMVRFILSEVRKDYAQGGFDGANSARYGAKPRGIMR